MDEGGSKDEGGVKGGGTLLHLGDHPTTMWRDTTWSTSGKYSCDHAGLYSLFSGILIACDRGAQLCAYENQVWLREVIEIV